MSERAGQSAIPQSLAAGASGASAPLSERVRALRLPEQAAQPRRAWLPWMLCLLFAVSTAVLAYRQFKIPPAEAAKSTPAASPANTANAASPGSPAAPANQDSGDVALESKGYIIPAHQILVSPKVSGMVESLKIDEGQRVKKGDVLAILESIDYQADCRRAEATLAVANQRLLELQTGNRPEEIQQARSELAEVESQRQQLHADLQRKLKLKNTKALSDTEFEVAESSYKAMDHRAARLRSMLALMVEGPRKERIDGAKAEVQQAEADLSKARWRLGNCTIRAPISGTILKKNAEEGNIVNPVAFNGSFSLCEMADLADLEVDLAIQERHIAQVFKGQRCRIRADAFPNRVYEGVVARLMPIADRAKGAVPIRVKLTVPAEEEGVYLKPEMGAVVSFLKH